MFALGPMAKAAKLKHSTGTQNFEAPLERLRSRLNWVVAYIRFDAAKVWGLRGQIKVKGQINGFAFRTCLFPSRDGRHFLLINKGMQKGARVGEGNSARFEIDLDREKRVVKIPGPLHVLLKQERSLRRWYDGLTPSVRNDIAKWITDPKSQEARTRRAEQMAERLFAVMDAERELPPILLLAFGRNPRARFGWEAMSPSRRRAHLFGIFYYRTPDAQGRRIGKMLDDAASFAERAAERKRAVANGSKSKRKSSN